MFFILMFLFVVLLFVCLFLGGFISIFFDSYCLFFFCWCHLPCFLCLIVYLMFYWVFCLCLFDVRCFSLCFYCVVFNRIPFSNITNGPIDIIGT